MVEKSIEEINDEKTDDYSKKIFSRLTKNEEKKIEISREERGERRETKENNRTWFHSFWRDRIMFEQEKRKEKLQLSME